MELTRDALSRLRPMRKARRQHSSSALSGGSLDLPHVVIGQAEMVAYLVHQHVPDHGAQGLVMLGPIIEDRSPIEPHHVRHLGRGAFGAERQADSLEEA